MMLDVQMANNEQRLFLPPRQEASRKRILNELIETEQVRPHFQPVIDLMTAGVLGYEILSRGTPPLAMPKQRCALRWG